MESALDGELAQELMAQYGSPLFVYEESVIKAKIRQLTECFSYENVRLLYACKANSNLSILEIFRRNGLGVDVVSPGELFIARKAGFGVESILATGNNLTDAELAEFVEAGVLVNADSLTQLEQLGVLGVKRACLRINPAIGAGGHSHIITGGATSKFGIYHDRMAEAVKVAKRGGMRLVGAHMHIGSNMLHLGPFFEAIELFLCAIAEIEGLEFVNFGGGLGIPYRPGDAPVELTKFGSRLSARFEQFCEDYGAAPTLVTENGRFFVAEAGHLLVRVTGIKRRDNDIFIGTDSGMNHIIRPVLYGAYHPIRNLTSQEALQKRVDVVGNICESGDYIARDRALPMPSLGDVLSIDIAGAYCFSMADNYNSRPRPAEALLTAGGSRLIRRRETYEDLVRTQLLP